MVKYENRRHETLLDEWSARFVHIISILQPKSYIAYAGMIEHRNLSKIVGDNYPRTASNHLIIDPNMPSDTPLLGLVLAVICYLLAKNQYPLWSESPTI